MDFALADHQEQLLRSVDRWIERSWRTGDIESAPGRRAKWTELVANGWTGLLSPGTVLDAALLVERLARGGCTLPVAGPMVAPYFTELAALGPGSGFDQLHLVDDLVSGQSHGLEIADRIVVLQVTGHRRWHVAAVDAAPIVIADEGRTVLSRVHPAALVDLREIDQGGAELAWRIGAVLSAAELVGLAHAVLDDCVTYAKVRIQGGKPIGGHQAIQHRLADMLGDVERSRYLTYLAATTVGHGATTEVHQAKALAARDCLTTIRAAHQVMGAISFSAEHHLHHFHKQAIVAAHEFGSAETHWAMLEAAG